MFVLLKPKNCGKAIFPKNNHAQIIFGTSYSHFWQHCWNNFSSKAENFSLKVRNGWNKCQFRTKRFSFKKTYLEVENAILTTPPDRWQHESVFFRSKSEHEKATKFSYEYFLPILCLWKQKMHLWLTRPKPISQKAKNLAQQRKKIEKIQEKLTEKLHKRFAWYVNGICDYPAKKFLPKVR